MIAAISAGLIHSQLTHYNRIRFEINRVIIYDRFDMLCEHVFEVLSLFRSSSILYNELDEEIVRSYKVLDHIHGQNLFMQRPLKELEQ